MSSNYGIPGPLLRFLGACIYGDARAYYAGLDESGRAALESQWKDFGMEAWAYRYLYDLLPETIRDECRKVYQTRQLNAMAGAPELKRLYRVLAAHGLRFVPIKGADLTYRLYPDSALRMIGDWDIWFHPDDCDRALAVLSEDGWQVLKNYSEDHSQVRKSDAHHYSPFIRGRYIIEPHFTLANFEHVDLYGMWDNTAEYPGGDGQRILTTEMNLMMLARHAASNSYYHANLPKLLTDAAMVMQREKADFAKLRSMAAHWRLPYPGDLFAAFPEFFPADVLEEFGADPEKTAVFRGLFELRGNLGKTGNEQLFLSRSDARGNAVEAVLNHIRSLSPERIRLIYHLPKHKAAGRVAWAYVCWFWTRIWRSSAFLLRRNAPLRDYARIVESVESVHGRADSGKTAGNA